MNQHIKSILTGFVGLLLFALGAGLRLKSEDLSTHRLPDAMLTADNGIKHFLDGAQVGAINEIALSLLWAGVALLVLSSSYPRRCVIRRWQTLKLNSDVHSARMRSSIVNV